MPYSNGYIFQGNLCVDNAAETEPCHTSMWKVISCQLNAKGSEN